MISWMNELKSEPPYIHSLSNQQVNEILETRLVVPNGQKSAQIVDQKRDKNDDCSLH